MPRTLTKIDAIAEKLIKELPPYAQVSPGEYQYIRTSTKLIHSKLVEYYKNAGVEPPSLDAVRLWFYTDTPNWALAILANLCKKV